MVSTRSLSPISRRGNGGHYRDQSPDTPSRGAGGSSGREDREGIWPRSQEGASLQLGEVLGLLALLLQVIKGLDQESAGTCGGVKNRFAETRVNDRDDKLDDRARRVELPESPAASRISRSIVS